MIKHIFYLGFPLDKFKGNSNVVLLNTENGGHIAFCEKFIPTGCGWVCHVLSDFLKVILTADNYELS
jgi:predicted alpha/beta-fold hydrolase